MVVMWKLEMKPTENWELAREWKANECADTVKASKLCLQTSHQDFRYSVMS